MQLRVKASTATHWLLCTSLTSGVGPLGAAGLLRRSFQRSFAGVWVIGLHEGLLEAVEVVVNPVMVHGCSAATGHHHHLSPLLELERNFSLFPPFF